MTSSDYVVSVERHLPFGAAEIFALLADPERHPDLDGSGTVKKVRAASPPLAVGSDFDMHMRRGFSYSTRNTVIALEPDRLISWRTRPLTFPLSLLIGGRTWTYELSPWTDGTRVTATWDLREERNRRLVRPMASDPGADMTTTLERLEAALARG